VRATGSTEPAKIGGYRKPLLAGQEDLLRELTTTRPGITLAEIRDALIERGLEPGSLTTIWSTLRRLGLSHKKSRCERPSRSGRMSPITAADGGSGSASWTQPCSSSSTRPVPPPT
jgi:transposase